MNIRTERTGTVATIALSGRVTVSDRPGLLKRAVAASVEEGATDVLLNLSDVQYMDSTRLGELIAAHVTVSRHGGRLKLIGTPERILELLVTAGLDDVFELYATVGEATGSLES
jgi:anti-sigma B factor antagonist